MTGSDKERELARQLDAAGYHVMRAPSSGGATTRDLPDLLWAKDGESTCVEMKYTGQNVAYFDKDEIDALQRFGIAFSAAVRLCVRFKQDTSFYLCHPKHARRTDSGRYAVDKSMNLETVL